MYRPRRKLFYGSLITVGVLLLLLLAMGSAAAEGGGVVTAFEAIDVACEVVEGDGDVNFAGLLLSDDERIAGESLIEVTFKDNGQVLVEATYSPEAVDGTWVAPGQGQETPNGLVVRHHGYGTGDLAGARIVFTVPEFVDLADPPCTPVGPVARLTGIIIEPPQQ